MINISKTLKKVLLVIPFLGVSFAIYKAFNHFHYNDFIEVNSKELKPVFNNSSDNNYNNSNGNNNSNNNTIAIAFASDNKYAKYTAVALQSILDNKSPQYNYDIVILENSISRRNKTLMTRMCEKHSNVSLRFVDMSKFDRREIYHTRSFPFSASSRIFIPEVFSDYEKVIYLDSDLIVQTDLSYLANLVFEPDQLIAAVRDMGMTTWRPEALWKDKESTYEKAIHLGLKT